MRRRPAELVEQWRAEAATLSAYGAEPMAKCLLTAAEQLSVALAESDGETVNLRQAALLSGYSEDHLGRLVRSSKLRNVGRTNAPLLRRGDLPIKPGQSLRSEDSRDQLSARRIAESVTTPRKRRA